MAATQAGNRQVTARKRGAQIVGVALLLLLLAVILMATLAPSPGEHYPLVLRLLFYALTGAGWCGLLVGLYRVIVGPAAGALAGPLNVIAVGVMVGGVAIGLVGAWAVRTVVEAPGSASRDHDHDWD